LVNDDAEEMQASDDVAARWFNAVIPIVVTLGVVLWLIIHTGKSSFAAEFPEKTPDMRDIFGWADSSFALQYGALAGCWWQRPWQLCSDCCRAVKLWLRLVKELAWYCRPL
jgi:hypothetical protein